MPMRILCWLQLVEESPTVTEAGANEQREATAAFSRANAAGLSERIGRNAKRKTAVDSTAVSGIM